MASHIGREDPIQDDEAIDDIHCSYEDYNTIKRIISNLPYVSVFNFSFVSVKILKILKSPADELAPPFFILINNLIK